MKAVENILGEEKKWFWHFPCYNVFNPSDTNFQLLECHYYVDIQHFYIRLF